jgi:hypothetical protein
VVIFKYPLNRAQNFVKRLVGMPGEHLRIENGDLWYRSGASDPWQHLRRPPAVLDAQLKPLDLRDPPGGVYWTVEPSSAGKADGRDCRVEGNAVLRFVADGGGPIVDTYSHGYPAGMQPYLHAEGRSGQHEVGDLRARGSIRAHAGFESLVVELRETGRNYHFEIPGPAAPASATPRVSSEGKPGAPNPVGEKLAGASHLPADKWVDFSAQNIDDVLTLAIDGAVVAELDVPPCNGTARESGVSLQLTGGGAELEHLRVLRDIYYTSAENGECEWMIPKDQYFMLGDNTQNSSDSREWKYIDMSWRGMPAGVTAVRGNQRGTRGSIGNTADANPIDLRIGSEIYTFLRDVWGELWIFPRHDELPGPSDARIDSAPFVPRNLITGRAVAVFWPFSIKYATYRWKWVR